MAVFELERLRNALAVGDGLGVSSGDDVWVMLLGELMALEDDVVLLLVLGLWSSRNDTLASASVEVLLGRGGDPEAQTF
jgi:hypothetical protein